jgi:hypothetical protein
MKSKHEQHKVIIPVKPKAEIIIETYPWWMTAIYRTILIGGPLGVVALWVLK